MQSAQLFHRLSMLLVLAFMASFGHAQQITGYWKGTITGKRNAVRVELKLVQRGNSLTGAMYYIAKRQYLKYAVSGYFDSRSNDVVWWDIGLVENKTRSEKLPPELPLLARVDFNCPGDGTMLLEGIAGNKNEEEQELVVKLEKRTFTDFEDDWDEIIRNYTTGGNDKALIDQVAANQLPPAASTSVAQNYESSDTSTGIQSPSKAVTTVAQPLPVAATPDSTIQSRPKAAINETQPLAKSPESGNPPVSAAFIQSRPRGTATGIKSPPIPAVNIQPSRMRNIEQKLVERKKVIATEIPLFGDSIELNFYDNAEIDGDSIALFLNNKLLFEHIRLSDNAYTLKLAVSALENNNELTMVAENLGTIPPNTSYMVAIVDGKRYEARLESTEQSSAVIRFRKDR